MRYLLIIVIGTFLVYGCASVSTTGTSTGTGKYSEDLSVWRPEAANPVDSVKAPETPERIRTNKYVEAKFAVNGQVDTILDSIYRDNHERGSVEGYTIQVYSGIKREDALNVRKKLTQSLPDLESEVQYRQPNFRVRSGQYFTRLEAQKDYLAIKRYFPNAIVIPDRIAVE